MPIFVVNTRPLIENQHNKVRVYSPGGSGDNIFKIWKGILSDLKMSNGLGYRLASRNIKSRYRQSILGILWAFLPPIATSIVWIILNQQRVIAFSDAGMPYPLFVVMGTTMWQMFTNSILNTLQTVNSNASLLTKINFPRESILFNAFYEILFNSLIGLIIILIMLVFMGYFDVVNILTYVPFMFIIILAGMTISLFILPFSLLFRDVQYLLPSLLQFLMYLTPVIYPRPVVSKFDWIFRFNPIGQIIQFIRSGIAGSASEFGFTEMAVVAGCAGLLFLFGMVLYRITMEVLIERMGS